MGKCEFAIRAKNGNANTYEIGVVKRRDDKEGYTFLYDFYGGGNGLVNSLMKDRGGERAWRDSGHSAEKPMEGLMQEYKVQVAKEFAHNLLQEGWEMEKTTEKDGRVRVRIFRETGGGNI